MNGSMARYRQAESVDTVDRDILLYPLENSGRKGNVPRFTQWKGQTTCGI
jgi:hypothetical protein